LCVYRTDSTEPLTITARVFCPDVGVLEDPGTGSAALGLGLVLAEDGRLTADSDGYVVQQGAQVGRPSRLFGRVSWDGAQVSCCHVAGSVVAVASGEIAPPPA
jgi:trans-2,3-dihydro-3-hydroxyanthranilate isomerase